MNITDLNERIGHYPAMPLAPVDPAGYYRQVWEAKPMPGAGAAQYAYQTRLIPVMNLFGAGQPLRNANPPSPIAGAVPIDQFTRPLVPQLAPTKVGTIAPQPLLPQGVVSRFAPLAAAKGVGYGG